MAQAPKGSVWLGYRWQGTQRTAKRQLRLLDAATGILGQDTRKLRSIIGSKCLAYTKETLDVLWKLALQSDVTNYWDWHNQTLVASDMLYVLTPPLGYSAAHWSYQDSNPQGEQRQPQAVDFQPQAAEMHQPIPVAGWNRRGCGDAPASKAAEMHQPRVAELQPLPELMAADEGGYWERMRFADLLRGSGTL